MPLPPQSPSKEEQTSVHTEEQIGEQERLASLRRCALLDTPPEAAFDRIADLAAHVFEVPLAVVSLVDEHRLWFKSCRGACRAALPAETSREKAPCAAVVLSEESLVLEDARLDPRFAGHSLVAGPFGLRFYAGAPLILDDGAVAGTLCLLDFQPRTFSPDRLAMLESLAASVVTEIELRRARLHSAESKELYPQMFDESPHPMWVFEAETLRFTRVNAAALTLYGYSREEFLALTILDLRPPEERPLMQQRLQDALVDSPPRVKQGIAEHQTRSGTRIWMEITAHSIHYENRRSHMVIAQDVTERREASEALRRSEQRLSLHVRQTPLAFIELDPNLTITQWNPAAESTFGYTHAEAVGRNIQHLIVPEAEQAHVESLRTGLLTRTGGMRSTNYNRTKSGENILCEWHNTPLIDDSGQVVGIASMARDITLEEAAQERLRRSETHKAAILNAAIDCIISINPEGRIIDWNAAAERTFGYSRADAAGQPVTDLILPPPLRPSYQNGLMQYLKNGNWPAFHTQIELPAQRRDGTQFQAELTATALQWESRTLYTLYLRDISERKNMEREREELLVQTEFLLADALERADHDPLTGLLNHRAFHKRLQEEVKKEEVRAEEKGCGLPKLCCGAVLLMDLDNFKFFNDAYGHSAGDDVLRQISHTFEAACHPQDTLARYGGDEFALLLPGASEADALAVAERLRDAARVVGYHPPGYETSIPFNLSIGLACFPGDASAPAALLEVADARLRISKSGGDTDSHALQVRRTLARSVGGFTMLDALVTAVDNKDRYTRRHSEDVMHYSLGIARVLGLDAETQRLIEVAALLHDVGKIGVPDAILRKPGRLSGSDYEAIKQHPMMGSVIVGAVPGFEEALGAIRHHHERWDGGGYPFGLAAEETPLSARLMAVADAYSAMTTDRPYRKGMDPQKALSILEEGAGTQWDPQCVQAFLQSRAVSAGPLPGTTRSMNNADDPLTDNLEDNNEAIDSDAMDDQPDGDRQLTTNSDALDVGGTNDSDLGADVAGDIGPKHD